jgi:hypothetical protein
MRVAGTGTHYGVHGQMTLHELCSFCSIRVLPMKRGMTRQSGVVLDLREIGSLGLWRW